MIGLRSLLAHLFALSVYVSTASAGVVSFDRYGPFPAHGGALNARGEETLESSAVHVQRFEGHLRTRQANAQSDLSLRDVESWYWGGGKSRHCSL
jgi:hypothetical protein